MRKTVVLHGLEACELSPGWYWAELEFERPATKEILEAALASMGFANVEIEDDVGIGGAIGATTMRAAAPKPAALALQPTMKAAPAPAILQQKVALATAPPPAAPAPTLKTSDTFSAAKTTMQAQAAKEVATAPIAPLRGSGSPGSMSIGPSSSSATSASTSTSSSAPSASVSTSASSTPAASDGGGDGYVPPNWRQEDLPAQQESYESAKAESREDSNAQTPIEEPALAKAPPDVIRATSAMKGRRVKVNNDPPMYLYEAQPSASVSGEAPQVWRFRFIGFLMAPALVRNLPGMRWTLIHPLAFDPAADLSWRVTPFPLPTGATLDLRFIARDKNARSRTDVARLLSSMGFSPARVMLRRRNLRMPGRPSATLSEWIGIGRWKGAASIVTSDDPLFFADVKVSS